MELPQLIILAVLLLTAVILAAKVYFLHRSAEEIAKAFHDIRTSDTNTLISVSSKDPYMRRLAADINLELRLLRKERRRCQQGDLELKEAVAGLSHDLRTPLTALIGYLDLLEQEENGETVRRYLSQIRNRTEALKDLTEELFQYSVAASSQELHPEPVDVVGGAGGKPSVVLRRHAGKRHRACDPSAGSSCLPQSGYKCGEPHFLQYRQQRP